MSEAMDIEIDFPERVGPDSDRLAALVRAMLVELGENPTREGLLKTPHRVANALRFLTSGYVTDPDEIINNAIFSDDNDEMVVQRDIPFHSLCEHHMLPFYGVAHVAYVPDGKVIGLSKIARLVNVFARRLQIQERMTRQIAECMKSHLKPLGVAVVVEAEHMCMTMRGVERPGTKTVTSAMVGVFKKDIRTRTEFLNLIHS
ncbi:MAG: GTP cyclohydrolase 1 [candidate division BRC1 bacterium ADurb.BinA364]|nr:MAG: GTP cyclohydrolase 1 [candidate division BRC1 bacterium ADurb.BinA364]